MEKPENSTPTNKYRKFFSGVKEKIIHSDDFFFTLLRSSVSSQICGWIDTLTAFLCFALFNLTAWLSTAIGAFVGGVFNYLVNYRFTFHADGMAWRVAVSKFVFVWAGSLLLNSFGTQYAYMLVRGWAWLKETTGVNEDEIFLATRLTVALTVSLAWNFRLQRNFVFKQTKLDPHIVNFLDNITRCVKKTKHSSK